MHAMMFWLARVLAGIGGFVLVALMTMTILSVIGRALNGLFHAPWMGGFGKMMLATGIGPIGGDFEVVEAGIAFSIACCLPWAALRQSHAVVDLVTNALPMRVQRGLMLLWDAVFAGLLWILAYRTWLGAQDALRYGDITVQFELPIGWAMAFCAGALAVAALVASYVALVRLRELLRNETILHSGPGGH